MHNLLNRRLPPARRLVLKGLEDLRNDLIGSLYNNLGYLLNLEPILKEVNNTTNNNILLK